MDGQRSDTQTDGRGWYADEPYGERSPRYAALNDERYAQPENFNPFGDESRYADEPARQEQPRQEPSYPERRSPVRRGKRSGLVIPDTPGYGDRDSFGDEQPADASYAGDYDAGGHDMSGYDAGGHDGGGHAEGAYSESVSDAPVRLTARDRQQLRERAAASGSPVSGAPAAAGPGALHAPTEAIPAGVRPAPAATYRSRRPGLAVLLALAGVFVELILLKVLLGNVFHSSATAISATLAALFALAGTPMTILGLYGLATGAATMNGPNTGRAWLRTPLAYLIVGLVLILAAGLAA